MSIYAYKQGSLVAATPTVVYTCPVGKTAVVQSIRVYNPAGYVFSLGKHDNGVGTVLVYQVTLSAGDTLTDSNPMVLKPNDYVELTSNIGGTNYVIYISEF